MLEALSGTMWHIYADENSRIMYTKKQDNIWLDPLLLDRFVAKNFSATIGIDEKVHLIVYTATKQLIYYQWNGNQWLYSIISTIRSRFQDVIFTKILADREHIHMIYHVGNTLFKSTETVYHYYGNGFNWQGGKILSFPSEDNINIIDVYWYNADNIYLNYSHKKDNNTYIYISKFNRKEYIWTNANLLVKTPIYLNKIQICADTNENIHTIGINEENNMYTLHYIEDGNDRTILSAKPEPFVSPLIKCLNDGSIYIAWSMNDKIFSIISTDRGKSFNKLKEISSHDISLFEHVTIDDNNFSHSKKSFARLYPRFEVHEKLILSDIKTEQAILYYPKTDELETMKKEVNSLKNQVSHFVNQFDDLYSILNSLRERIIQYEQSLYQMQLTIKRQTNEIERLQKLSSKKNYQNAVNYSIEYEQNEHNDKIEMSGEENEEIINVGNTKIIINREEDVDDREEDVDDNN